MAYKGTNKSANKSSKSGRGVSSGSSGSVGVSVGGKSHIVKKGSDIYNKYMSQGGVESAGAKTERSNYLKSLNKPGSANYRPVGDEMEDNPADLGELSTPNAPTTTLTQTNASGANIDTPAGQPPTNKTTVGQFGMPTTYTGTPEQMLNRYKQGLGQAQASGAPAPSTQGQALTQMSQYMTPEPPQSAEVFSQDPFFQEMGTTFEDFMSPPKQRETLTQEYARLTAESGIEALDTQLMNMQNVIDGTEDDIRNEITKAGGFASESQVLAMTNARNKSMIKNYNNLLDLRESKQKHMDTMLQLSAQDRAQADADFDRKFNIGMKMMDYRDKMKQNAVDGYNKIVSQVGYSGLASMAKGDPYYTSLIEKTLGLSSGGLSKLSRSEISQNTKGSTSGVLPPVGFSPMINPTTGKIDPLSQFSSVIKNSGAKTDDKLKLTGAVIANVQAFAENNLSGNIPGVSAGSPRFGIMRGPRGTQNVTNLSSLEGTVESWMTGASVSDDQAKRIKKQMLPRKGDTNKTIRNKTNALMNYMLNYASGTLASQGVDWQPENVDFFTPIVVTNPMGEQVQIID